MLSLLSLLSHLCVINGILFFFHETDESNPNMGQGKALNYNVVDAYAKLLALLVRYMNGGGTTELLNLIESKKAVVRKQRSEIKTNGWL